MAKRVYPKVSFIIPTLNAGDILPRCLNAIRSQEYPTQLVEIIIADGGSTDSTLEIAKTFGARIIVNPEILHEPGKDRASKVAKGEIFFFTDADNILENNSWLINMVYVYIKEPEAVVFLPQTVPAPDSISLDRYLGYLSTDPFTWFIYKNAASPRDYKKMYAPIKSTFSYELYRFTPNNHPLIGLTQGFGTRRSFNRGAIGHADDILAMIKLIEEKGIIAYVTTAGIYHYHVTSVNNFINKYRWRVRNNLRQDISGMGLVNRLQYFNTERKIRIFLFLPYALTLIGPFLDTLRLIIKYKDAVLLWHPLATFLIATIILWEHCAHLVHKNQKLGTYE